jgi:ribosomal protein S12 methylthiotransferase accessory factor
MSSTYKLPRRVFKNSLEFWKYKLGFSNLTQEEILLKVANLLAHERGLNRMNKVRRYDNDFPDFYGYYFSGEGDLLETYGASLTDSNEAMSKLLGEYMERTEFRNFAYKVFTKDMTINELKKLYGVKIPTDFNDFGDKQKEFFSVLNWNTETLVETTQVEDVINHKNVFYPTQLVFYNRIVGKEHIRLSPRTSTGCAGGFDLEQTTLSGIYECVERDAFLLHWLTETPGKRIIFGEKDLGINKYIKKFAKFGFEISFFDITSDIGIPVVLSVCEDKYANDRKILISSASSNTFETAIWKTLTEVHTLMLMFRSDDIWPEPRNYKENFLDIDLTLPQRCRLLYKENAKKIDFIFSGGSISLGELQKNVLKNSLDEVVRVFKDRNYNLYRYVSTNPFLKDVGYKLVRVLIPQLLQYYMQEPYAMVKGNRIKGFLRYKGLREDMTLNTFPHPFP